MAAREGRPRSRRPWSRRVERVHEQPDEVGGLGGHPRERPELETEQSRIGRDLTDGVERRPEAIEDALRHAHMIDEAVRPCSTDLRERRSW